MMRIVCLMLLPFGWTRMRSNIYLIIGCSMRPIIDTTRYFHHIHTHTHIRPPHNFHVPCEWPVEHKSNENFRICLTFGCFLMFFFVYFAAINIFFVCFSPLATFRFVFIARENSTIFWRHAKSTLLISIQKNANTNTSI